MSALDAFNLPNAVNIYVQGTLSAMLMYVAMTIRSPNCLAAIFLSILVFPCDGSGEFSQRYFCSFQRFKLPVIFVCVVEYYIIIFILVILARSVHRKVDLVGGPCQWKTFLALRESCYVIICTPKQIQMACQAN